MPADCGAESRGVGAAGVPRAVVARLALLAGGAGLLFGVDLGGIGGALAGMEEDLGLVGAQVQLVVSVARAGAVLGCLLGGSLAAVRGRRAAIEAAVLPFVLGPLAIVCCRSVHAAVVGRLVLGVGLGIATVSTPLYLSEVSPPAIRGQLVSLFELAIALGFLLAAYAVWVVEEYFAPCLFGCWRYQAGMIPLCMAVPLAFAVQLVPESPRWLLSDSCKRPDKFVIALEAMLEVGRQGARERLRRVGRVDRTEGSDGELPGVGTEGSADDLVALWDERHAAAGSPLWPDEKAARGSGGAPPHQGADGKTISDCTQVFAALGAQLRVIFDMASGARELPAGTSRSLALAVIAATLNLACGSSALLVYGQMMIGSMGEHSKNVQDQLALLLALAKLLGVVVGLAVVESCDRRRLLGLGGASCLICLLVATVGAFANLMPVVLGGICGFLFSFFCSWGTATWVVVAELTAGFGPKYGNASQAAATAMIFLAGGATEYVSPTVWEVFGDCGMLPYAAVCLCMILFSFLMLPETRGCSLQECTQRVISSSYNVVSVSYSDLESTDSDLESSSGAP